MEKQNRTLSEISKEIQVDIPTILNHLKNDNVLISSNPDKNVDSKIYKKIKSLFENMVPYEIYRTNSFINDNFEKFELNPQLKIAFSNFKKFVEFPEIEFKAINFFVGPNNSGKSTAVSAFLLVSDYLLNQFDNFFRFDKISTNGTWDQHKNKSSKNGTISFSITVGDYEFNIIIEQNIVGLFQNPAASKVVSFSLKNQKIDLSLQVLFNEKQMILTLDENIDEFQKVDSNNFQNELIKLNQDIEQIGNLRNRFYFDAIDKRNKVLHQIEFFKKKEFIKGSKRIIEVPISIYPHLINDNKGIEFNLENLVDIMNNNIRGEIKTNKQKIIVLSDVNSQSEYDILLKENLEVLIQQLQMILDDKRLTNFTKDFKKRIEFEEIIYLGANLNKQSPLFLLSDEHNQLSQAIHSFAQLNEINSTQDIYKHDEEIIFLLKWIRQFKIGLDFEIKPINGIAYNFNFSKEIKPSFVHPLSEMGMGSIQLMTLLLRLATLIRKSKKEIKIFMVVVEEPELNLHPNFQSKLCDLFYEVHKKYQNIRFVIETHSEYIIRKSQLIGKENKLFEDNTTNPFNVIYFDNKNGPYEMIYRPDGKFSNEFGTGFFDESTNLAFDLF